MQCLYLLHAFSSTDTGLPSTNSTGWSPPCPASIQDSGTEEGHPADDVITEVPNTSLDIQKVC